MKEYKDNIIYYQIVFIFEKLNILFSVKENCINKVVVFL